MAKVGLHNVPIPEPHTTSSIRQMWRELEDESVVNHAHERGRSRSPRENVNSVSNSQEDIGREALEDLSEIENGDVSNSRSLIGVVNENEECLNMNLEQSQEPDDPNEGQIENNHRGIRRLRGRQDLLDLLGKKEQERKLELQILEGTRPVTSFSYRNRIQILLRMKCSQYMRSVELTKPSSDAETELDILRQRQTVSGLREGFLSRLDNNAPVQSSDLLEGPSDCSREDQMQGSSSTEILDSVHKQNQLNEDDDVASSGDVNQLSECSVGETNFPELTFQVEALDSGESNGSSDDGIPILNAQEASGSERVEFNLEETDREEIDIHTQARNLEYTEEQVTEYEESEQEDSVLSNNDQVETDDIQRWPDDGEESSQGVSEIVREQNDGEEDYWHENASQDVTRDWMVLTSGPGATSSGRVDTYYFSDDDNSYNMELRELVNRRTVSSLLHSSFRESLDQLIESYVERQTHAPDWELRESPPLFVAHHRESGTGQGSRQAPRGHWGSRHNISERTETEWEIVNDLRIDMARLQQKLNSMHKILETCVDMQLELQRCIRQEVSAALNRSTNQSELPRDSSKWDCVRKGICCICSDTNIDSLLNRCGHMCTCTKCGNILVQENGKCPMCQAPIIEVIRAFFIQ